MTAASDMIADLQARLRLVNVQSSAGLDAGTLLENATQGFIAHVCSQGGLELNTVADITEAVVQSTFTTEQKRRIGEAVATQQIAHGTKGKSRGNQACQHIEDFLTDAVWTVLYDANLSLLAKLMYLANFLHGGLNISCPGIKLLQRCIQLVTCAHTGCDLATPDQRRDSCHKLQSLIKDADQLGRMVGVPHVVRFPTQPDNLPESVRSLAYATSGPVPSKIASTLISKTLVPYKDNHSSLKHNANRREATDPAMKQLLALVGPLLQRQVQGDIPISYCVGGESSGQQRSHHNSLADGSVPRHAGGQPAPGTPCYTGVYMSPGTHVMQQSHHGMQQSQAVLGGANMAGYVPPQGSPRHDTPVTPPFGRNITQESLQSTGPSVDGPAVTVVVPSAVLPLVPKAAVPKGVAVEETIDELEKRLFASAKAEKDARATEKKNKKDEGQDGVKSAACKAPVQKKPANGGGGKKKNKKREHGEVASEADKAQGVAEEETIEELEKRLLVSAKAESKARADEKKKKRMRYTTELQPRQARLRHRSLVTISKNMAS